MHSPSILAGNWKMNLGPAAAAELTSGLKSFAPKLQSTELWIAPPAVSIGSAVSAAQNSPIRVGSQNVHWEDSGAFTGEISIPMLREIGASFAIVGHSERRHVFGEINNVVVQRALYSLGQSFSTIVCVGETLDEREAGTTDSVLSEQLSPLFSELPQKDLPLVIAYEPVWAIGTGKTASLEEIQAAHLAIQNLWQASGRSNSLPILYGGSVKPENYEGIIALPEVSGALVGGASLKLDQFQALAEIAEANEA